MANKKEMIASDFNLQKITTEEFALAVDAAIESESAIAVFGRRGTGKTMITKERIKKHDNHVEVYWNLSTMERVDVGGYPDLLGSKGEFVNFKLPSSYEKMINGNQKVVALLDEVDKADPSLWAPLLEFVQFKTINGRKLPNLAGIIMTGNLVSEGGAKPCLPLLDRAAKFLIEPDVKSWMDWAGESQKIHPSVTAYIHDNPNDLFGAVDPDESYADPSPRSWENASKFLKLAEKAGDRGWSKETTYKMVAGCVGNSVGLKYRAYFDHYYKILPIVDKLMSGKDIINEFKALSTTEQLIITMIVCSRCATEMDSCTDSKLSASADNVLKNSAKLLSHNAVSPEYCLIAVRSQLKVQRLIKFELDSHEFGKVLSKVRQKVYK